MKDRINSTLSNDDRSDLHAAIVEMLRAGATYRQVQHYFNVSNTIVTSAKRTAPDLPIIKRKSASKFSEECRRHAMAKRLALALDRAALVGSYSKCRDPWARRLEDLGGAARAEYFATMKRAELRVSRR